MKTEILNGASSQIHYGDAMTIEAYHADKTHLSSTGLKEFIKSPGHYMLYLDGDEERKRHFDFGNAFEIALLDPDAFDEQVYVLDDRALVEEIGGARPTSTKAYKEWKAQQMELAGDRYVIPATGSQSMEVLNLLMEKCKKNSLIQAIIKDIEYQASCFWTDKQTGVQLKTRPDVLHLRKRVVIDIKTTVSAEPRAFARQAAKLNYPLQAALHVEGVTRCGIFKEVDAYFYLVAEKEAPNHVQLFQMSDDDLAAARDKLRAELRTFAAWQRGELSDGYDFKSLSKHGILPLEIPAYYFM